MINSDTKSQKGAPGLPGYGESERGAMPTFRRRDFSRRLAKWQNPDLRRKPRTRAREGERSPNGNPFL